MSEAEMLKRILHSMEDQDEKAIKEEINEEQKQKLDAMIIRPDKEAFQKDLTGLKTGTLLDNLYLKADGTPLGGIPEVIQIGVVGLPASGKSILIEEIAVRATNFGVNVLLVTSEDSFKSTGKRMDLQNRLYQKAEILGLSWKLVIPSLYVIDTVTYGDLKDWYNFFKAYTNAVEKYKIGLVLIDSVTLLEDYRGALKKRLQYLCQFNQINNITAIYVNQRAKEDWDTRSMAGGIGLGHILDSTVLVDYGVPSSWKRQLKQDFKEVGIETKQGDSQSFVRVIGCRLCGFNGKYQPIEITKDGFVKLIEPAKEVA